eukprot:GFKZ01002451.1.p1 GENE.GFKZ01002451.1~~GFKZ01002451.1.p1  ORF type:complete len:379 (+),score=54.95 GFKZ01002451.1:127-1263(+)
MPPSLQDMTDAYVLASVLSYSAAKATYFYSSFILAALASSVLLINSHYLSAPSHPPSTVLAILSLAIPLRNNHASGAFNSVIRSLQRTPEFALEALVGFLLLGWAVQLAILQPLARARESRRSVQPIRLPSAEQAHSASLSPEPNSHSSTVSARNPPQSPLTRNGSHPDRSQAPPPAPSADRDPSTAGVASQAVAIAAASPATLQPTTSGSTAYQNAASSSDRTANLRRRRPPTKSQLLAVRIMEEREAQERRREMAAAARQAEMKARSEAAKAQRLERERRRKELQEQVKEGAKGVGSAKEALVKAMAEANDGRMKRRRAADQLALQRSEDNERLLDEACKESARLEMAEQMALNEVNAAQARWTDLQARLNAFDRS